MISRPLVAKAVMAFPKGSGGKPGCSLRMSINELILDIVVVWVSGIIKFMQWRSKATLLRNSNDTYKHLHYRIPKRLEYGESTVSI